MKYYVIEMQDGSVLWQCFNRTELESGAAASNFYSRCASAAISTVAVHTVMFVDENGHDILQPVVFRHGDGE